MKSCPKCKRTYADDGFTFCLEDGALLSAPYDPTDRKENSTLQNSGPPPTAVLPEAASRSREPKKPASIPQTVASPTPPPATPPKTETTPRIGLSGSLPKKFPVRAAIISAVILVALGVSISIYVIGKSGCPKVSVHCAQMPSAQASLQASSHYVVYCRLVDESSPAEAAHPSLMTPDKGSAIASLKPVLAFQQAARPASSPISSIEKVSWSTSLGKVDGPSDSFESTIDITGLSGRSVTVTANFAANSRFCSGSASTTFVAQ